MSGQRRKQRKRLWNAPLHKRQKLVAGNLSSKLRKDYGRRSLSLRAGDGVEIVRGDHKGVKGKIISVDLKNYNVMIDSVKRRKVNGTEVHIPIHPSNLRITDPAMSDKRRANIIKRSGGKVTITKETKEVKKEEKKETSGVKCQICNESFNTKKELSDHMGEKHKDYTQ